MPVNEADRLDVQQLDLSLLAGIKNRDQESLERLYQNYFPRLNRFITQMTQDPEETLDVINEVFLTVWNQADRFRGDSSLSSWIIGIAYNKSLSALRKRRKWLSFSNDLDEVVAESTSSSTMDDIKTMIKKLSPEQRAMMELTYYFGYSYDEIASMLGCTPSVVRDQLYHARKKVKKLMGEGG